MGSEACSFTYLPLRLHEAKTIFIPSGHSRDIFLINTSFRNEKRPHFFFIYNNKHLLVCHSFLKEEQGVKYVQS